MSINYESLMEQLTNCVNQLGHIRKQLQQEVQRSNTPADQVAVLREENAALQARLETAQEGMYPSEAETETEVPPAPKAQQVATQQQATSKSK